MIESWNHAGVPTRADFSNAHRQYARIATLDATARTYPRNDSEYPASARRWLVASLPSDRSSALRLPVTMNNEPAPATIKNHGEIETPTAMPPAIARSTKPHATAARSSTGSCLSQTLYANVNARYPPTISTSCQRAANDRKRAAAAKPIPAATAVLTDTSPATGLVPGLRGMQPAGLDVERVVEEVRCARGQAEAHECDEGGMRGPSVRTPAVSGCGGRRERS